MPRSIPAVEVLGEWWLCAQLAGYPMQARDVPLTAALRHQPATGLKRRVQAPEQAVVIGDPVEDRVGEHRVDRLFELQIHEIAEDDRGALAERPPGSLDHGGRGIDRHDATSGQALEQEPGDPARAAA